MSAFGTEPKVSWEQITAIALPYTQGKDYGKRRHSSANDFNTKGQLTYSPQRQRFR
jgi:hypothetical protein